MRGSQMKRNPFARTLRQRETPAEKRLWVQLRNRRLDGFKFRRQHWIGPFIVDFCCPEHYLVIEVDGAVHFRDESAMIRDKARQNFIVSLGYRVLRFTNTEIQSGLQSVLDTIWEYLPSSDPSGHLLPNGEKDPAT